MRCTNLCGGAKSLGARESEVAVKAVGESEMGQRRGRVLVWRGRKVRWLIVVWCFYESFYAFRLPWDLTVNHV